jgi:hypothetical protein
VAKKSGGPQFTTSARAIVLEDQMVQVTTKETSAAPPDTRPRMFEKTMVSEGMHLLIAAIQEEQPEIGISGFRHNQLRFTSKDGSKSVTVAGRVESQKAILEVVAKLAEVGVKIKDVLESPDRVPPAAAGSGPHGNLFGIPLSEGSAYLLTQLNESVKADMGQLITAGVQAAQNDNDWQTIAEDYERQLQRVKHERDQAVADLNRQLREANDRATQAESDLRELQGALSVLRGKI